MTSLPDLIDAHTVRPFAAIIDAHTVRLPPLPREVPGVTLDRFRAALITLGRAFLPAVPEPTPIYDALAAEQGFTA